VRGIDKFGPPPSPEMQRWYSWVSMWAAIGQDVFDNAHRCPHCGGVPMVHWKPCALNFETHCMNCYLPKAGGHEPWCDLRAIP
jgi:hypothetical protein